MTTSLRRPRFLTFFALVAVLLLGLLAVGRGQASEPTASASAAKGVSIVNFAFKPGTLKVKRGASVTFTNTANTTHTATSASFDTKRLAPGAAKAVKFGKRGTFFYHCKIHPFMKGKIVVE